MLFNVHVWLRFPSYIHTERMGYWGSRVLFKKMRKVVLFFFLLVKGSLILNKSSFAYYFDLAFKQIAFNALQCACVAQVPVIHTYRKDGLLGVKGSLQEDEKGGSLFFFVSKRFFNIK